jgi:LmbE family N-acetylglucosaminyl deacetylase
VKRRVRFYADYPYAAQFAGGQIRSITPQARQVKYRAMRCYVSQLSTFWQDETAVAQAAQAWVERELP